MTSRGPIGKKDDIVVLRSKYEQVDELIRRYETLAEELESRIYVGIITNLDAHQLLVKLFECVKNLAEIGISCSGIEQDLDTVRQECSDESDATTASCEALFNLIIDLIKCPLRDPSDELFVNQVGYVAAGTVDLVKKGLTAAKRLRSRFEEQLREEPFGKSNTGKNLKLRNQRLVRLHGQYPQKTHAQIAEIAKQDPNIVSLGKITKDIVKMAVRNAKARKPLPRKRGTGQ